MAPAPGLNLIAGENGERYDYLIATRGSNYAFIYTYTGRNIPVDMEQFKADKVKASWFDPRNGETTAIGEFETQGVQEFDAPGEKENGNDWVLILDEV